MDYSALSHACMIQDELDHLLKMPFSREMVPFDAQPSLVSLSRMICLGKRNGVNGCLSTLDMHCRKKQKIRKTVRFAEETDSIGSVYDLSEKELKNLWIQSNEYGAILDENHKTIATLSKANGDISILDNNEMCARGLEYQISYVMNNGNRTRYKNYVQQILLEQKNLYQIYGVANPQMLRVLSMALSQRSRNRALYHASLDAAIII